jgi:hypothetical protein
MQEKFMEILKKNDNKTMQLKDIAEAGKGVYEYLQAVNPKTDLEVKVAKVRQIVISNMLTLSLITQGEDGRISDADMEKVNRVCEPHLNALIEAQEEIDEYTSSANDAE